MTSRAREQWILRLETHAEAGTVNSAWSVGKPCASFREARRSASNGYGRCDAFGGQVAGRVSKTEEETRAREQELMERVAEEANLVEVLGRVCASKGSAGIDQMSVAELRTWMSQRHRAELRERLISGS